MGTDESIRALEAAGYFHYIPWKGRMSPFWDNDWVSYDISKKESTSGGFGPESIRSIHFTYTPIGRWSICNADGTQEPSGTGNDYLVDWQDALADAVASDWTPCDSDGSIDVLSSSKGYSDAVYCQATAACPGGDFGAESCSDSCENAGIFDSGNCCGVNTFSTYDADGDSYHTNIASRMIQKEALHHAQGAFWVSIVVVQWADLLICKTRWLSMRTQGMKNSTLNFGLFFETLLSAWLCYCLPINIGLGTRNIRLTHWFPGIPYSILIFTYDETRKFLMRSTSLETTDKATGQVRRIAGWLERNTYY